MRKLFALPVLMLLLLLSLPAAAEMTTIGKFYVDVPEGWIVTAHDTGFNLTAPDGKCAAGVNIRNTTERDSLSFASTMSQVMGGSIPRKVPGSSAFVFLATMEGIQTENVVHVLDGQVLLFTITGDGEPYLEELNLISATMNSSVPEYAKMFK
ncbi:hypothetical protein LJC48_03080 [Desulfovibrio sp. OttesenSCG-928-C06]|nr:hypothetical protein [Desulfovibrio sp. OttesenSCG-928-C06]